MVSAVASSAISRAQALVLDIASDSMMASFV